ncbi:hypothetical protein H0H93_014225 [Arthromyces matolae]|nr:hypothetical protein H0H93_014225 [Arthromyces matolae]
MFLDLKSAHSLTAEPLQYEDSHFSKEHPDPPTLEQPHEVWNSVPSSPTTSASTLSEDVDVEQIFLSKPNCLANSTSDPALYADLQSFDFPSLFCPLPIEDLNPHATPFIPKAPAPKSRRLLRPAPGSIPNPRKVKWRRTFDLATRPPVQERDVYTFIMVAADAWEPEQLAELAQEFCWRFSEATQDDLEVILDFLLKLVWRFKLMKPEGVADMFEWHLKECILGTFVSVWEAVSTFQNSECSTFDVIFHGKTNSEGISYQHADSQVIKSARMLAVAVGELFRRGFLDTKDVYPCLKTLMENFVSIEHADAVAALFQHMGPRYWYEHPDGRSHLWDFQYAFSCIAQKLEGKMSLLNLPLSTEELTNLIHGVAQQAVELDKEFCLASKPQVHMQRPPLIAPIYSEDPIPRPQFM